MFVRESIRLARPFQAVAPRFVGRKLPVEALARVAIARAYGAVDHPSPRSGLDGLKCTRGALWCRRDAIVVPLQWVNPWHAIGPTSLEGDLGVAPRGARTELTVEASYDRVTVVPMLMDPTCRVTELAVRGFLEALSRTLSV